MAWDRTGGAGRRGTGGHDGVVARAGARRTPGNHARAAKRTKTSMLSLKNLTDWRARRAEPISTIFSYRSIALQKSWLHSRAPEVAFLQELSTRPRGVA